MFTRRYCYVGDLLVHYTMEAAPFPFERSFNARAQKQRKLSVSYAIVNEIERQVTAEG